MEMSRVVWIASLRSVFICWLLTNQKLPTTDRLRRWRITMMEYVLCVGNHVKVTTYQKLFLECGYTISLRHKIMSGFLYDAIEIKITVKAKRMRRIYKEK